MKKQVAFDASHRAKFASIALLLSAALTLAGCSNAPIVPQAAQPTAPSPQLSGAGDAGSEGVFEQEFGGSPLQAQALTTGSNDLTTLAWTQMTNGWGPAEVNRSNGEAGAQDGRTLTLNGKTYARGLGVHSTSQISYNLAGQCQTLRSDIGVDDEVGHLGSVAFQVFGDGVKLYDSGRMTGATATKKLQVDIQGRQELKLVVTSGGDGLDYDHANWAAPLLDCTVSAPAPSVTAPVPGLGTPSYAAPLVITQGGTYTGAWESSDPAVPAVHIKTSEPVVLHNCLLRGKGDLIRAAWVKANLTVRHCRGTGLNPGQTSRFPGRFLQAEGVVSVLIEHNTFEKTSGIYINGFSGPTDAARTITIHRNVARDIEGRYSDGLGGYQSAFHRVQFVQLNNVKAVPRVEVAWNRIENTPRQSHVEDVINFHASSGTADSPMQVHNNLIFGAYAGNPSASYSGGGIMLGDGGGQYQKAANNVVLETSNYGVAVASGNDIWVSGNTILGTGKLSDGTILDADGDAGIYLRDYAQDPGHRASSVVAENNLVGWSRPLPGAPDRRWDLSISSSAGVGVNNARIQLANRAVAATLLSSAAAEWNQRAAAAGITPGAQ